MSVIAEEDQTKVPWPLRMLLTLSLIVLCSIIGAVAGHFMAPQLQRLGGVPVIGELLNDFEVASGFAGAFIALVVNRSAAWAYKGIRSL